MKEYKEPKIASNLQLMDSLKYHVTLDGLIPGVSEADIKAALYHSCGKLEIRNIIIKKTYCRGVATGEVRLELNNEFHVEVVRKSLPLKVTLEKPGYRSTILLREKSTLFSKKKLREIKYLESQGILDLKELKKCLVRPSNNSQTIQKTKTIIQLKQDPQNFDENSQNRSFEENQVFHSSFRAVMEDIAVKNQSLLLNFEAKALNHYEYIAYQKNTRNIVFNRIVPVQKRDMLRQCLNLHGDPYAIRSMHF
jgi:hypothetical protein